MVEQSLWMQKVAADPGHSQWYIERFRSLARDGEDLSGEARFVDAMVPRGARILDAGCGAGRVGGSLSAAGHHVVGVDVDPALIEAAGQDHPGPQWLVGDLAELDLPARGIAEPFDVIVSAGNVMAFLAPSTRVQVLGRLRAHLAEDGRAVIGFGAGRDYAFTQFLDDAAAAELTPDLLLSTWDLRPFVDNSDFLVAVLREGNARRER
ncbi:class I SAM-dependent methyltransferase [Mycobacterium sp. CBMA271]|uniref:class I SAM-dependent methyltransferase n=1 Tax=unclassified Mycobacteroides TaxID=2618759 RepID=UPI0012DE1AAA|nr:MULTISPECIES: class I SAM-dependent methyltransferase [unclassified Mycobacteroides]MUM18909.1 SAM-dependent methyltransferase [Mycobacteroides sp. CBMA 326]MUM23151.1 class I SAM-dependent methyltransferase [Mycobacteroides sp. CBMA 271]